VYCKTFRISLVAMTVMAFAVHCIALTGAFVIYANWSKDPINAKSASPAKQI
jgi:hypothetical protein